MRNFEERKAEIFCRSENRIKEQKKKRNRAFSVGVSLCLILIVFVIAKLPQPSIIDDGVSSETINASGNEEKFTIDANENEQICKLIESVFKNAESEEGYDDVFPENEPQASMSGFLPTGSLSSKYKFTLTDGNAAVTYTLNGLVLTNETTKESVTLNEDQRSRIIDELALREGGNE